MDRRVRRSSRWASISSVGPDAVQLVVATNDPAGGGIALGFHLVGQHVLRMTVMPDNAEVDQVFGGFVAAEDEHFVGLGERFTGLDQRGRTVEVWADDRRVAGYGPSTYAPIPLLLSSRGFAFGLERFERSRFDLAASQADRWLWQQDAPAASITLS